jgi:hypothetical protein
MADTIDVANTAVSDSRKPQRSRWALRHNCSGFGSGIHCPNGCLQQIAASRLTIPQDVAAILLQGFVRRPTTTARPCPYERHFLILRARNRTASHEH